MIFGSFITTDIFTSETAACQNKLRDSTLGIEGLKEINNTMNKIIHPKKIIFTSEVIHFFFTEPFG